MEFFQLPDAISLEEDTFVAINCRQQPTYLGLHVNWTTYLPSFNNISTFSTDLHKSPPYQILRNSVQWGPRWYGQTKNKKLTSTYAAMRRHLNIIAITVQYKMVKPLFGSAILYLKLAKIYLLADTKWMWRLKEKEFFPVRDMKAHRGRSVIAPFILNFGPRSRWVVNFTSQPLYAQEVTPVPTEEENWRALEPVWTFWRWQDSLAPVGIRTLVHTNCNTVTLPTTLSWLNNVTLH